MTYEEIEKAIKDAPVTYLPALLRACVEESIKKRVFVEGGLLRFVTAVQYKNGATPGTSDGNHPQECAARGGA